jgi:hypothetical protein
VSLTSQRRRFSFSIRVLQARDAPTPVRAVTASEAPMSPCCLLVATRRTPLRVADATRRQQVERSYLRTQEALSDEGSTASQRFTYASHPFVRTRKPWSSGLRLNAKQDVWQDSRMISLRAWSLTDKRFPINPQPRMGQLNFH